MSDQEPFDPIAFLQMPETKNRLAIGHFVSIATMIEATINGFFMVVFEPLGRERDQIITFEIFTWINFKRRCLILEELIRSYEDPEFYKKFRALRVELEKLFEFRNELLHHANLSEKADDDAAIFTLARLPNHPTKLKTLQEKTISVDDISDRSIKLLDIHNELHDLMLFFAEKEKASTFRSKGIVRE